MKEIERCYKILRINKNVTYREMRKAYNSAMLTYHPSRPKGRNNRVYFKELVLAFDLLSKIKRRPADDQKSVKEIYMEWYQSDRAFALEKAELYAQADYKDFEKEFLPGCITPFKGIAYLLYLIAAVIALWVPIMEYRIGNVTLRGLMVILVVYGIPFFYVIYKTIVDENFITRRLWFKLKLKLGLAILKQKIGSTDDHADPDETELKSLE